MGYLNPLFELPAAQGLLALSAPEKAALAALMMDLRRAANDEAEIAWRRRKGPIACYWRAVATYARHIGHVLRKHSPRRGGTGADAAMALRGLAAQEVAMTAQDLIAIFMDLSTSGRGVPLDDAIAGLAAWLARRRPGLSDDDFAALAVVGAAMCAAGPRRRRASATCRPAP